MPKRAINLRLDDDLVAAVDTLAEALDTDRTEMIARGLRRELLYDGRREFIYVLLDAERVVRYVGRARDPVSRLREHIAGARAGGTSAKEAWISEMLKAGTTPFQVIIDDGEPGEDIRSAEDYWLAHFEAGGSLTNGIRASVASQLVNRDFVQVRIPAALRDRIDAARGSEKREAWVREACERKLNPTHRKVVHAGTPTNHEAQRAHVDLMAQRQRNLEKARKR